MTYNSSGPPEPCPQKFPPRVEGQVQQTTLHSHITKIDRQVSCHFLVPFALWLTVYFHFQDASYGTVVLYDEEHLWRINESNKLM